MTIIKKNIQYYLYQHFKKLRYDHTYMYVIAGANYGIRINNECTSFDYVD